MIKKIAFTLALAFSGLFIYAQETTDTVKYWKFNGGISINFSQVALSNWSAGGENSYAMNGVLNLGSTYSKNNNDWANTLNIGYGLQKQGDQDVRKTDDQLDFVSKYGRKISNSLFMSAMLNFKTQFTDGKKYEADTSYTISRFMAPAYLQGALGFEYKPSEVFYAVLSPGAVKLTIVMDDTLSAKGAFGVKAGDKSRLELGGAASFGIKTDIMKNVSIHSTLGLFSNYLENPQNIDVNWDVFIHMKINDYLSANLTTQLIYDDDIKTSDKDGNVQGARVQFKEVFGVGLTYKF